MNVDSQSPNESGKQIYREFDLLDFDPNWRILNDISKNLVNLFSAKDYQKRSLLW